MGLKSLSQQNLMMKPVRSQKKMAVVVVVTRRIFDFKWREKLKTIYLGICVGLDV